VELAGPGISVPLGRGRAHHVRILTELALYAPAAPDATAAPASAGVREVRIGLGR
jgi:hypothetical protein